MKTYLEKLTQITTKQNIQVTSIKDTDGWYTFEVKADTEKVAEFSLVFFPGCCGIIISTEAKVKPKYRNRGIGTLLNKMRRCIAYQWGYSLIICTDIADNKPQRKILKRNKWKKLHKFTNKKTGNRIMLHAKKVKPGKRKLGFSLAFLEENR